MENITFYEQINLILENKGHENPRPVYTSLMHAYASMDLRMQLGFQKAMKVKFSTIKPNYFKAPKASANSLFLIAKA